MPEATQADWDRLITRVPDAHLLQVPAWGELKSSFGWQVARVVHEECGAQILFRRLPFGLSMAYIPKGPVGSIDGWELLWPAVDLICQRNRSILLLVEPDLFLEEIGEAWQNPPAGFSQAIQNIQPQRTLVIDLAGDEFDLLARMKQKTRYNIRLAQKRGIEVRASQELGLFHQLMRETGERDRFGVHTQEYYQKAYDLFYPEGKCELLFAYYQGDPIAGLMVFFQGESSLVFLRRIQRSTPGAYADLFASI